MTFCSSTVGARDSQTRRRARHPPAGLRAPGRIGRRECTSLAAHAGVPVLRPRCRRPPPAGSAACPAATRRRRPRPGPRRRRHDVRPAACVPGPSRGEDRAPERPALDAERRIAATATQRAERRAPRSTGRPGVQTRSWSVRHAAAQASLETRTDLSGRLDVDPDPRAADELVVRADDRTVADHGVLDPGALADDGADTDDRTADDGAHGPDARARLGGRSRRRRRPRSTTAPMPITEPPVTRSPSSTTARRRERATPRPVPAAPARRGRRARRRRSRCTRAAACRGRASTPSRRRPAPPRRTTAAPGNVSRSTETTRPAGMASMTERWKT